MKAQTYHPISEARAPISKPPTPTARSTPNPDATMASTPPSMAWGVAVVSASTSSYVAASSLAAPSIRCVRLAIDWPPFGLTSGWGRAVQRHAAPILLGGERAGQRVGRRQPGSDHRPAPRQILDAVGGVAEHVGQEGPRVLARPVRRRPAGYEGFP